MSEQLSSLPSGRKLALAGGAVLFVASFLPWWHVSVGVGGFSASASASGWHRIGPIAFILAIALVLWEVTRIAGLAPVHGKKADMVSALLAGAAAAFALIFFLTRVGDDAGWGIWVGLVGLLTAGYAAFLLFTASGGVATVRDLQGDLQAKAGEARERAAATAASEPEPAATPEPTPPAPVPAPPAASTPPAAPQAPAVTEPPADGPTPPSA